jgi:hypothetical protein
MIKTRSNKIKTNKIEKNVQHDIRSTVWVYNDSRDLFKVNAECYN